jgi:hypothetical protein
MGPSDDQPCGGRETSQQATLRSGDTRTLVGTARQDAAAFGVERTTLRTFSVWGRSTSLALVLMIGLLLLPENARAVGAAACRDATLMLIHPEVAPPYDAAIDQIQEGLEQVTGETIGVCTVGELQSRPWAPQARQVVAIGESAYAAAKQRFPSDPVLPILVGDLPAGARSGLSRFIAPALVLKELRVLSPATRVVYFVHLREVPSELVGRASEAARALGLRWAPIAVGSLREAARAIEKIKMDAGADAAVWFHRGVLALNADVLVPPIVRLSWDRRTPVFTEDAEAVARGLLFSLTPDYRRVGRSLGAQLRHDRAGLADIQAVRRVLNRRTARAIGLAVSPAEERRFDDVYD